VQLGKTRSWGARSLGGDVSLACEGKGNRGSSAGTGCLAWALSPLGFFWCVAGVEAPLTDRSPRGRGGRKKGGSVGEGKATGFVPWSFGRRMSERWWCGGHLSWGSVFLVGSFSYVSGGFPVCGLFIGGSKAVKGVLILAPDCGLTVLL